MRVDRIMQLVMDGLKQRKLHKCVNLVILSDHGNNVLQIMPCYSFFPSLVIILSICCTGILVLYLVYLL